MEKVKCIFIFMFFFCLSSFLSAQEPSIIRPGLIKSQLTITPSYMFSDKQSYYYLHGNLEGFLEKNISLSGEGYYSLGNISSGESTFEYNHSLFGGINYHFTKKNSDLYIGFQPGISITKLKLPTIGLIQPHDGVNPLASFLVGFNFYVNRFFHFFIQNRFIVGQHNYDVYKNLAEYRFSAGLGFNFNTIKAK